MRDNDIQEGAETHRRRQVLRAIGAAGVASIAGCTGDDGNETDSSGGETTGGSGGGGGNLDGVELHVMTDDTSDPERQFWNKVAGEFEQETGATVALDFEGFGGGIEQRAIQLTQSGIPPEVVTTSVDQVSNFLVQDVLAPFTPAYDALIEIHGEPNKFARVESDGEQYFIPSFIQPMNFWYRGDLFEEPPSDWDTLLAQAKKIDSNQLRGILMPGGAHDGCVFNQIMAHLYSNEARVCSRSNGEIQVVMTEGENRDRWIETLEFMQELHNYSNTNSSVGCGEMIQAIPSESAACNMYAGSRPKVQSIEQEKSFAADVHTVGNVSNRSDVAYPSLQGFMSFKGSENEAANTFMQFFFENYAMEYALIDPMTALTAWPEVESSDEYQSELQGYSDEYSKEDLDILLKTKNNFMTLPHEVDPPNPYAGIIKESYVLQDLVAQVLIGGTNPDTALEDAAKTVENLIGEASS